MRSKDLDQIIRKVPVTYYQKGVKSNFLQKIWHGIKISYFKKIIQDISFSKCLDIGCASGYMLNEISNQYPNISFYGIDPYNQAIKYGQKTYPHIKFTMSLAEKLPFKDNFFDLILCYETIEHVKDAQKALQEIKRVLDKKGLAVITMDSGNWLFRIVWFIWEKTSGKVWQGAHLHPFHHRELGNLIKKTGFRIIQKNFTHLGMEVVFIVSK